MDSLIKPIGHELTRGSRAVNKWLSKKCPAVATNPIALAALVHDSVPDPAHPAHPAHPRNPWLPTSRHQRNRVRDPHEPGYDSTATVEPAWQQGWMVQTPLGKYRMANGLAGDAPMGETREERNQRVFSETVQWFAWTKQHCDARGWGTMDEWGARRKEGEFAFEMVEMGGKQAEARQDANFTSRAAAEAERQSHSSLGSSKFKFNPTAYEFTPLSGLSPTSASRKGYPSKKKRDEGVQAGGFTATAGPDAAEDEETRYRAMLERSWFRAQKSSSAAEQNSCSSGGGGGGGKEQVGEASSSSTAIAAAIDDNNAVSTDHHGEQDAGPASSPAVADDDDDDDDVIIVLIEEGSQDSSSSSWETDSIAASASTEEPVVVVGASTVAADDDDNDEDDVIGEGSQASSDPSSSDSSSSDFSSSWEMNSVAAPTSADDQPAVVVGASIVAIGIEVDEAAAASPPPETAWAPRVMPDARAVVLEPEFRGRSPRLPAQVVHVRHGCLVTKVLLRRDEIENEIEKKATGWNA